MKRVKEFLSCRLDQKRPLLLAYSGGPDSQFLFHALMEIPCPLLHVAHVDHGWREESSQEAAQIRKEMEMRSIPFHSIRLSKVPEKNREEFCRLERLSFFRSLFALHPFQALLLGHQADDLAETALKRLFEGASLPFLGGMEMESSWEGIPIWRPLLKIKKSEILFSLKQREISFLLDPTNQDPAYLRSRLRTDCLPLLRESFGKEIIDNLVLLSERAYELKSYLDRKIATRFLETCDWGFILDCQDLERIERRHLIQTRLKRESLSIPRTLMESLLEHLEENRRFFKVFFHSYWIAVFQQTLFLTRSREDLPSNAIKRLVTNELCKRKTI